MAAVTAVLENVGASFVLVTVSVKSSLADAPPVSEQVTVMVCVPTSALTGVPLICPEAIVRVVGAPDIDEVRLETVSSPSMSVHIEDTSYVNAESSATV